MSAISEVSGDSQALWGGGAALPGGAAAAGRALPGRALPGRHRASWRPADGAPAETGAPLAGASLVEEGGPVAGVSYPAVAAGELAAARDWDTASLLTRTGCGYVRDRRRQPLALLQAGHSAGGAGGVDLAALRASCRQLSASAIDDGTPVTTAALSSRDDLATCALGDLRTVPLLPRSYDIVDCCLLLHRIQHAELVLDRIVGALKPGGLLLLRTADRDCAAGFIDRVLPLWARRAVWRLQRPGQPGPYPAVYGELASGRGIQSYAARRGLVIVRREPLTGPAADRRHAGPLSARRIVARLSRGRLTAEHDELAYVILRPEDRSARLL